jgi:hypothetical protein
MKSFFSEIDSEEEILSAFKKAFSLGGGELGT